MINTKKRMIISGLGLLILLLTIKLMILADYYHVSIDYLLYHTDVRKPYPKSIVYSEK